MTNDRLSAPHLLIVDDEPTLRVMFTVLLQGVGYEPVAAGSAEKALERLGEGPIDLVLTDLVMPGIGGVELIATLRRLRPELPVVAMTGADDGVADRARAAGAAAVLRKPVAVGALLSTIERSLDGVNSRKDVAGRPGQAERTRPATGVTMPTAR